MADQSSNILEVAGERLRSTRVAIADAKTWRVLTGNGVLIQRAPGARLSKLVEEAKRLLETIRDHS